MDVSFLTSPVDADVARRLTDIQILLEGSSDGDRVCALLDTTVVASCDLTLPMVNLYSKLEHVHPSAFYVPSDRRPSYVIANNERTVMDFYMHPGGWSVRVRCESSQPMSIDYLPTMSVTANDVIDQIMKLAPE